MSCYLLAGGITCLFSLACALILAYLDKRAEKLLCKEQGKTGEWCGVNMPWNLFFHCRAVTQFVNAFLIEFVGSLAVHFSLLCAFPLELCFVGIGFISFNRCAKTCSCLLVVF